MLLDAKKLEIQSIRPNWSLSDFHASYFNSIEFDLSFAAQRFA